MSGQLVATVYGGSVVVTPGSLGSTISANIYYRRYVGGQEVKVIEATGSEASAPARLFFTQTDVDALEDAFLSVLVNGVESFVPVINPSTVSSLATLNSYGLSAKIYGTVDPIAALETSSVGSNVTLRLRRGTYPSAALFLSCLVLVTQTLQQHQKLGFTLGRG